MKKKIAFILNDYSLLGGVEKVTSNLSTLFYNNNILVHSIISLNRKNEIPLITYKQDIPIYILKNKVIEKQYFEKELVSYIIKNKIERLIIQVQDLQEANIIIKSLSLTTCKCIPILHNTPYLYTKWYFPKKYSSINAFLRFLKMTYYWKPRNITFFRKIINDTKVMICVGDNASNELVTLLPEINANYISSIPNPINFNKYVNLNVKKNEILYVGRLTADKNSILMIEIWRELEAKFLNWKFNILGNGECFDEMNFLIKKYDLKNIKLWGNISDVENFYKRSKISVLLSHYEGLPTFLLEASYYENALVGFNGDGGTADIIENGKNGYLLEVNNKKQVLKTLSKMMRFNEQNTLTEMGKNAKESLNKFSDELILKSWQKILA